MRSLKCLLLLITVAGSLGFAANPAAVYSAPPILPKQFAGWQIEGAALASKDVAAADPTNAAL